MLPPALGEALDLDAVPLAERASFFSWYARREDDGPGSLDLIELAERGPFGSALLIPYGEVDPVGAGTPAGDGEGTADPIGAGTPAGDGEDTAARAALEAALQQLGPPRAVPAWVRMAETADAWREAAIARLLISVDEGRDALELAASAYHALGLPYGWYLDTVAGRGRGREAASRLADLLFLPPAGPDDDGLIGELAALRAPAQQVYTLLAAVSEASVAREYDSVLRELAGAPQARGVAPVGSTAQAVGDWWAIGLALVDVHRRRVDARAEIVERLVPLARAHGDQLRRAQWDRYHWRSARPGVDLVDVDLAGAVCLADRAVTAAELGALVLGDFAGLPPLAAVSVAVGLQLSRGEGDDDTFPVTGTPDPTGPPSRDPTSPSGPAFDFPDGPIGLTGGWTFGSAGPGPPRPEDGPAAEAT